MFAYAASTDRGGLLTAVDPNSAAVIIAHSNATYLAVLAWQSEGILCEDQPGFIQLNGTHTQQWAMFVAPVQLFTLIIGTESWA